MEFIEPSEFLAATTLQFLDSLHGGLIRLVDGKRQAFLVSHTPQQQPNSVRNGQARRLQRIRRL